MKFILAAFILLFPPIICNTLYPQDNNSHIPIDQFSYDGISLGTKLTKFKSRYPKDKPIFAYNGVIQYFIKSDKQDPVDYIFIDNILSCIKIKYYPHEVDKEGGIKKIIEKLEKKYGKYSKYDSSSGIFEDYTYVWSSNTAGFQVIDRLGKKDKGEVVITSSNNRSSMLIERLSR